MLWFLILFLVVSALTSALTYLRGFSFSKLSVLLRIKVSKSLSLCNRNQPLYFQLHFSLNPNQSKCTPKGSLNDLIIWNLFHWSLTKSVTDVWFIFVFVYGKWQWITALIHPWTFQSEMRGARRDGWYFRLWNFLRGWFFLNFGILVWNISFKLTKYWKVVAWTALLKNAELNSVKLHIIVQSMI